METLINYKQTRNFCIIAHIDHGKSTLADRLIEYTNILESKHITGQVLDDMDIEQERGITIKSHPIQMNYKHSNNQISNNKNNLEFQFWYCELFLKVISRNT